MFGISGAEIVLILVFAFLIFGPDKLPDIAKTVGKAIAKFRDAQEDMNSTLKNNAVFDKDSDTPFKNPLDMIDNAAATAKKTADTAKSAAAVAAAKVSEKAESFSERKARYDKERAARLAAEQGEPTKKAVEAADDAAKESTASASVESTVGKSTVSAASANMESAASASTDNTASAAAASEKEGD